LRIEIEQKRLVTAGREGLRQVDGDCRLPASALLALNRNDPHVDRWCKPTGENAIK
jgi:hypothetical protein